MTDDRAYIVLMDTGGLFGCFLDCDLAARKAEAIKGVVLAVPMLSDYREKVTEP